MNYLDLASLASGIGALIAALVALFTLLELFKQRKSSYKPDLCIVPNEYELEEARYDGIDLAIDWVPKEQEESNLCFSPGFRIVNIGLGAAKKVEIKWEFDVKGEIHKVNKMAEKLSVPSLIKEGTKSLSIKINDSAVYSVHGESDSMKSDYVVPHISDPKGAEIPLPLNYRLIVSAYLSMCSKENLNLKNVEVPDINLNLKYIDIGKGIHKSFHRFSCTIPMKSINSKKLSTYILKYMEGS